MRSGQGIYPSSIWIDEETLQFASQFGTNDIVLQSYDRSCIPDNGGKWEKYDLVKLLL